MNIYLASPYTSEYDIIMEGRYYAALDATADLIRAGYNVFSPIVHSHYIGKVLGNGNDSAYWTALDLSFIERWAELVIVLRIDGYKESGGIKKEVALAGSIYVPVIHSMKSFVIEKALYGHMWE